MIHSFVAQIRLPGPNGRVPVTVRAPDTATATALLAAQYGRENVFNVHIGQPMEIKLAGG